jgi:hypothetical protein
MPGSRQGDRRPSATLVTAERVAAPSPYVSSGAPRATNSHFRERIPVERAGLRRRRASRRRFHPGLSVVRDESRGGRRRRPAARRSNRSFVALGAPLDRSGPARGAARLSARGGAAPVSPARLPRGTRPRAHPRVAPPRRATAAPRAAPQSGAAAPRALSPRPPRAAPLPPRGRFCRGRPKVLCYTPPRPEVGHEQPTPAVEPTRATVPIGAVPG